MYVNYCKGKKNKFEQQAFFAYLSDWCLSLEKVDSQNQQLCGSTIVRNVTSITMK